MRIQYILLLSLIFTVLLSVTSLLASDTQKLSQIRVGKEQHDILTDQVAENWATGLSSGNETIGSGAMPNDNDPIESIEPIIKNPCQKIISSLTKIGDELERQDKTHGKWFSNKSISGHVLETQIFFVGRKSL